MNCNFEEESFESFIYEEFIKNLLKYFKILIYWCLIVTWRTLMMLHLMRNQEEPMNLSGLTSDSWVTESRLYENYAHTEEILRPFSKQPFILRSDTTKDPNLDPWKSGRTTSRAFGKYTISRDRRFCKFEAILGPWSRNLFVVWKDGFLMNMNKDNIKSRPVLVNW